MNAHPHSERDSLTSKLANRNLFFVAGILTTPLFVMLVCAARTSAQDDAPASRAAFLQLYRVLTSPRCQNCHPAGDAPLQGDDSHVHIQNIKRGADGHGVTAMRCDTCHLTVNLSGAHMPPGNPKWALPSQEHRMVFVGRSPAELCRQIKDPKQNGGRTLEKLLDHVANDDLVGWGWNPGDGRSLPPLSRPATVEQMKTWIASGAACPQ